MLFRSGATTSGATRLDLISTAANGKDWYLNSYSDGNFYIGEVGGADRLTIAKSTGNTTLAGTLTVTGATYTNGQLNVQGNQVTKFSDPAGNVGNNYSYIKTEATTSNTSTLLLGTCQGIATQVDAISIYNSNTTLAGTLTVTSTQDASSAPSGAIYTAGGIAVGANKKFMATGTGGYWGSASAGTLESLLIRGVGFGYSPSN